jgi:hypothetical protein
MKIPAAPHFGPARTYFEPISRVGALAAPSEGCWIETVGTDGAGVLGWLTAGVAAAVLGGVLTTGGGVATDGGPAGAGVTGAGVGIR